MPVVGIKREPSNGFIVVSRNNEVKIKKGIEMGMNGVYRIIEGGVKGGAEWDEWGLSKY